MIQQIWIAYEEDLRRVLNVPANADVDDVLALIREERWEPNLCSREVEGVTLWACPIQKGIFSTVQGNPETGMMGQEGLFSPILASLEGLRRARNVEQPQRPRQPDVSR